VEVTRELVRVQLANLLTLLLSGKKAGARWPVSSRHTVCAGMGLARRSFRGRCTLRSKQHVIDPAWVILSYAA
jgi:hypothetical protein